MGGRELLLTLAMAKKKTKASSSAEAAGSNTAAGTANANGQLPTPAGSPVSCHQPQNCPSLIICRNKHWKYISAFHGPWLQMPIEILETLANLNYNSVRPRPIDVASLYDLVKVRRLVDDATTLAVKAASDVVSSTLTNVNGQGGNSAFGFDMHPGHGQTKLSRERKFRMREQASQKLARAYRLDKIACSVATMQGASPLDGWDSMCCSGTRR